MCECVFCKNVRKPVQNEIIMYHKSLNVGKLILTFFSQSKSRLVFYLFVLTIRRARARLFSLVCLFHERLVVVCLFVREGSASLSLCLALL